MNNKLGKNFDGVYLFTKVWKQVKYDDNKFKSFIKIYNTLNYEKNKFRDI